MPWRRLNPAVIVEHLCARCEAGDEDMAEQALAHLREALLSGAYIAVEDEAGRTFIGSHAEATDHMMEHSGQ